MSSEDAVVSIRDLEVYFEEKSSSFARRSRSVTELLGVDEFLLEGRPFENLLSREETGPVRAVDGVSMDIPENDVIALVGESGCGKTTLGKAAIGIHRPRSGQVLYRGQDIWDARDGRGDVDIEWEEIRRALQIIHQDPSTSLNPNKTVKHTLSKPLEERNPDMSVVDKRQRIHALLERVGMSPGEDYANRFPHQLSGGEKQRVALLRALLMNPDLILADEAVSALDVSLRIDMMDLMLDLQEEVNTSFLFISHNLSNASYFAGGADGRIGIMYLGEIVEFGPVDEVLENPQHPYTKALIWATPNLDPDAEVKAEIPLRRIDVPDARNPPSGCRFHTRCPEAREICREESPELEASGDLDHEAACYRARSVSHPYWSSPDLAEEDEETSEPEITF